MGIHYLYVWVKTIITFIKKLLRKTHVTVSSVIDPKYVIPRTQHHVSKTDISVNALKVLNRLNSAGFQAYLVGGSVRDLLLRKVPKDFDVATNATPNQIKALFRNARIIGRRFKLVHILYQREIIEVATFRSHEAHGEQQQINHRGMLIRDNVYGTLEEDAWRRDFTINSLYYSLKDASIIDFTGGVMDVNQERIRIIGDPTVRYQEDPVRMLRAIRFSAKLHFNLDLETAAPLSTLSPLLTHVSGSRLFDEITKLYQCGEAVSAHQLLVQHGLFDILFEQTHRLMKKASSLNTLVITALENTDARIRENKPVTPAFLFAIFLWFPLLEQAKKLREAGLDPLPALEKAMSEVIAKQNAVITIPKRYTQIVREIWLMQYRFPKRHGKRAFHLLAHPRFRAAYDFLALRALAGDESMDLVQWWTQFQDVLPDEQQCMIAALPPTSTTKRPKKNRPPS